MTKFEKHPLDGDVPMVRYVEIEIGSQTVRLLKTPEAVDLAVKLMSSETLAAVAIEYSRVKDKKSWRYHHATIHYGCEIRMRSEVAEDVWKRRQDEGRDHATGNVLPPPAPDQPEPPLAIAAPLEQIEDHSEEDADRVNHPKVDDEMPF